MRVSESLGFLSLSLNRGKIFVSTLASSHHFQLSTLFNAFSFENVGVLMCIRLRSNTTHPQ